MFENELLIIDLEAAEIVLVGRGATFSREQNEDAARILWPAYGRLFAGR
jgi:hypothetical protein